MAYKPKVNDRVEITGGEYKGCTGRVSRVDQSAYMVTVRIDGSSIYARDLDITYIRKLR